MLEDKLDAHLDYFKHDHRKDNNTRNGVQIKMSYG